MTFCFPLTHCPVFTTVVLDVINKLNVMLFFCLESFTLLSKVKCDFFLTMYIKIKRQQQQLIFTKK